MGVGRPKVKLSDKLTEKVLRDLYLNQKLGQPEIAKKYKVSTSCIGYYIKKYKIPLRKISESVSLGRSKAFQAKRDKKINKLAKRIYREIKEFYRQKRIGIPAKSDEASRRVAAMFIK